MALLSFFFVFLRVVNISFFFFPLSACGSVSGLLLQVKSDFRSKWMVVCSCNPVLTLMVDYNHGQEVTDVRAFLFHAVATKLGVSLHHKAGR